MSPQRGAFSAAGKTLAELHLTYEDAAPYPHFKRKENGMVSYKVEKMKLRGKVKPGVDDDRTWSIYDRLVVNDTLTIYEHPHRSLGNRSASESVVDQYRVKTDKRSGITSTPTADQQTAVDLLHRPLHIEA